LKNINFKLYKEELLGIYGLQGSGRTELLETIYGLSKQGSKEIKVFGKKQKINSSKDALINNFALIPEDRRKAGIFENMDIKDNIAVIHNKKITTSGFISKLKILRMVREFINKLDIKTSSPMKFIGQLSGGNQQKVIIARFLSNKPKILLLDEPTKGIDVGAKAEIFKILRSLIKDEGLSIIMVSSEIEEVISECDRVLILRNGKIAGEVEGERKVKEKILQYAFSG
jgi:ribose transport system ATP-binding protein